MLQYSVNGSVEDASYSGPHGMPYFHAQCWSTTLVLKINLNGSMARRRSVPTFWPVISPCDRLKLKTGGGRSGRCPFLGGYSVRRVLGMNFGTLDNLNSLVIPLKSCNVPLVYTSPILLELNCGAGTVAHVVLWRSAEGNFSEM